MIKILAELKKQIGEAIITEACREKPAVFEYKQYKKDPVYTITVTADYDRVGEEKLESTNECQISRFEKIASDEELEHKKLGELMLDIIKNNYCPDSPFKLTEATQEGLKEVEPCLDTENEKYGLKT